MKFISILIFTDCTDGSGGHAFTLQAVVLLTAVPDCSIQSQTTTVEVLMIMMWMMMVIVTIKK